MVSDDHPKFDQVTDWIPERLILTSFFSDVPGLKVSAKKKRGTSKHADHSSTLPPAFERIKAQLERRKKRQEQARETADNSEGQPLANVGSGEQTEPAVVRKSGGGNKQRQGSKIADTRREGPTDEEEAAAANRAFRKKLEAARVIKKRRKLQKAAEDADIDLQYAIEQLLASDFEDFDKDRDEPEVATGKRKSQVDENGVDHDHPASQAAGGAQRTKVSSQMEVHQERLEKSQNNPASQAAGSFQRTKVSSQREVHQERLENLVSQRRSQTKDDKSKDEESSSTESESEEEQLPLGEKRVSWKFLSLFHLMFLLVCFKFSAEDEGRQIEG
jgi:hypothetical protein